MPSMNEDDFRARYNSLRSHLRVELLEIDQELMRIPMLLQDAAELASETSDDERETRHIYDVAKADAGSRLRNPKDEKAKVPSETMVAALIPLEADVQEARADYDIAQSRQERATALVHSLREKSRILGKISDMIMSGFITPSSIYEKERSAGRKEAS